MARSTPAVGNSLGLSPLFMGVVLIPLAGSVSEVLVGMRLARRNQFGLAVTTLSAAAMQVALLVTPVLVLAGLLLGTPLSLAFGLQEVISLGLAVFIAVQLAGWSFQLVRGRTVTGSLCLAAPVVPV